MTTELLLHWKSRGVLGLHVASLRSPMAKDSLIIQFSTLEIDPMAIRRRAPSCPTLITCTPQSIPCSPVSCTKRRPLDITVSPNVLKRRRALAASETISIDGQILCLEDVIQCVVKTLQSRPRKSLFKRRVKHSKV